MPNFSSNNPGSYIYTVPAGAKNVSFSIAGEGGGNFSVEERNYAYNLTFYISGRETDGLNNSDSGIGSGGAANTVYDSGLNKYIASCDGDGGNGWFLLSYTESPPSITFFGFRLEDNSTQEYINIFEGESVTLTYSLDPTKNMNSVGIDQGLGWYSTSLVTNNITLTPAQTTTYTLTVSGSGGTVSDTTSVTVFVKPVITASVNPTTDTTVLQPPTAILDVSATVPYASTVELNYQVENAYKGIKIFVAYKYRDDTVFGSEEEIITLPGANAHSGDVSHLPQYNDLGPYQLKYKIQGTGSDSLNAVVEKIVNVNVDMMPEIIDNSNTFQGIKEI